MRRGGGWGGGGIGVRVGGVGGGGWVGVGRTEDVCSSGVEYLPALHSRV